MQELIIDCSTGEQTVRDLTPDEIAEREAQAAAYAEQQAAVEAEAAAREAARVALAERLGLTVDDLALLRG